MRFMGHLRNRSTAAGLRIDWLVAAYCVATLGLTMLVGSARVLTYAIPPLALLAMLAVGRVAWSPNAPPYLVLIVAAIALAPLGSLLGLQDVYLMLIGLSPFAFGLQYKLQWRHIFWAAVVATILSYARKGGQGGGVQFDPLTSQSSFEATTSFVFGVLAAWAVCERRWRPALLALVLCILTLKRIVALGAILAFVVMMMPRGWMDRLLRPIPMLLLNALYLYLIVKYAQGSFDRLIFDYTDQSSNQFGMGRQQLYHYPIETLLHEFWRITFIGLGPGSVYEVMKGGWGFLAKTNLHNDSLKMLIEYGGIAWMAFFAVMYRPSQRFEQRVLMMFVNVMLLTDNALIYPYVIFAIGIACQNLAPQALRSIVRSTRAVADSGSAAEAQPSPLAR
ncbi:MAG TPA: O-antigen ligase family protein [Solimonas sp.]|nr:O-antigen ligase family protein [Solimonas sp.]